MEIVPVIDVKNDVAVQAIAGDRENYEPIRSKLIDGSDWVCLAKRFKELGFSCLYIADLDALGFDKPPNQKLLQCCKELNLDIMLDTNWFGFPSTLEDVGSRCQPLFSLEMLANLDQLQGFFDLARSRNPVFSLDFIAGKLFAKSESLSSIDPMECVEKVVFTGFREMILLDLSRVGTQSGPGMIDMIGEIKRRWPALKLISGGGVRTRSDLEKLGEAGCDRALVASALHQQQLSIEDSRIR